MLKNYLRQKVSLYCARQKEVLFLLPFQNHSFLWFFLKCCSVAQLCPTLCDPMDCSMPRFPVPHLTRGCLYYLLRAGLSVLPKCLFPPLCSFEWCILIIIRLSFRWRNTMQFEFRTDFVEISLLTVTFTHFCLWMRKKGKPLSLYTSSPCLQYLASIPHTWEYTAKCFLAGTM